MNALQILRIIRHLVNAAYDDDSKDPQMGILWEILQILKREKINEN